MSLMHCRYELMDGPSRSIVIRNDLLECLNRGGDKIRLTATHCNGKICVNASGALVNVRHPRYLVVTLRHIGLVDAQGVGPYIWCYTSALSGANTGGFRCEAR